MRLELMRKTELALLAMETLAELDARTSGERLAEGIGTTREFLPQVMAPLVKRNWVKSTRGPSGGYELAVGLREVTVLDLIETVEGATDRGQCVLSGSACDADEPCALHDAWSRARDALLAELGSISLADAAAAKVV